MSYSKLSVKRGLDAITGRATYGTAPFYIAASSIVVNDTHTMSTMGEIYTPGTNGYNRVLFTPSTPSGWVNLSGSHYVGPFPTSTSISSLVLVTTQTGTSGEILGWYIPAVHNSPYYILPQIYNAGEGLAYTWISIS